MLRRSTDSRDYQRLPRPVAVMATDYPAGHAIAPHLHERGQLVFAAAGVMAVTTPDGTWVVPPHRAVWVPPATEHAIRAYDALQMRSLYIRGDAARHLPPTCAVVPVSPLLRELILRAIELPLEYEEAGPAGRIMALILDELAVLPALPLHLPWPRDERLRRVCAALRRDPAAAATLAEWGRVAGASGRTLARLFRRETGMSFAAWRQQARLLEALGRLARGDAVTTVAMDLGYRSPSAFTSMFRRALGRAPRRYFVQR